MQKLNSPGARDSNLQVTVDKAKTLLGVEKIENSPNLGKQDSMKINFAQGEYQDEDQRLNKYWYEMRLQGKQPDRRAYHTTFMHNRK